MKIALDYDDTYTADPDLWTAFIYIARSSGHQVTFVTYRHEPDEGHSDQNDDVKEAAKSLGIDVVFTHGQQKAGCFYADIWIDDMPLTIPVADDLLAIHKGCKIMNDFKQNKEST